MAVTIRSMTATFGKLNRAHLELEEGFNLIEAPNEGGKSTWCAFWKAMLYGIDTRDRDRKGYLADKNRYQPWSGAPMEGEVRLDWQGRDITIRRGPKGNTPFGAFSAVYTATGEPVPGLTAATCGELLTGVGKEVFERSAFIGSGGDLTVTAAPELEKRIAALVSSGEEDVSFSQTQAILKEWRNRRQVNRSVGLIPKLEGELAQVDQALTDLEEVSARLSQLSGERETLLQEQQALTTEVQLHRRRAQSALDARFTQAKRELEQAQQQLAALEGEAEKYGPLPDKERLKGAQGELQYLKVLSEEIRQGEDALKQAEDAYVQAQIDAQDPLFQGLSGEEAGQRVQKDLQEYAVYENTARAKDLGSRLFPLVGLAALVVCAVVGFVREKALVSYPLYVGLVVLGITLLAALVARSNARDWRGKAGKLLGRYGVETPQEALEAAERYRERCRKAEEAAAQAKTVRGALNDRKARRDNSQADLIAFVHTFAPQITDLFGCSAALSRALGLDHELALTRERVEERRRRAADLAAQGGRDTAPSGEGPAPSRTPQETDRALAAVTGRLEQVEGERNQALGRQRAMGDPALLHARKEELEEELGRRQEEYQALQVASDALDRANSLLQERFSPQLSRLAGDYLARLTGQAYTSLTLNRELEGSAQRPEDVLPRSVLALSRGTADQLYLAVRLAVCGLCLPEKPPVVLDDALAAFDDQRLSQALELLLELAKERQVLLFTCQTREAKQLSGQAAVHQTAL